MDDQDEPVAARRVDPPDAMFETIDIRICGRSVARVQATDFDAFVKGDMSLAEWCHG